MNFSVVVSTSGFNTVVSELQYKICIVFNSVVLSTLVGLFGIVTNLINLIVFYKQGLNSSINITLFALAISDLSALLLQQLFNVFVNPWFESSDIRIVPSEFKYLTAGVPRIALTRVTCLITVYMTMERCLCIIFPLHIKQMITPRKTAVAMVTIYILTCLTYSPLYCTSYIGWKFYSNRNKTLLGLIFTANSDQITQIVYFMLTFLGLVLFAGVVIFTSILINKLGEKNSWRRRINVDRSISEKMTNRDRKTMSMVVLLASILIVCNIPSVILFSITFFEPEFSIAGIYSYIFMATWSVGFLFETLNSSVNIFLYVKMSTKYRETFYEIFACKNKQKIILKQHVN